MSERTTRSEDRDNPDTGPGRVTVEVPASYVEAPRRVPYARFQRPVARLLPRTEGNPGATLMFHKVLVNLLDNPKAVRCFTDGDRLAVVPSTRDHPNSYPFSGNHISVTWLRIELESGMPEFGVYEAERDGDVWVLDFGSGPLIPDEELR